MKVAAIMETMLECLNGQTVFTITPGYDIEFYGGINYKVGGGFPGVTFYFPPPYSLKDRGKNGLLREYFLKEADFMNIRMSISSVK